LETGKGAKERGADIYEGKVPYSTLGKGKKKVSA